MKHTKLFKALFTTGLLAVLALSLVGCVSGANEEAEKQAANRLYMSNVNQVIEELNTTLSDFGEALSQEDFVSMKTQAEKTSKIIGELEKIEAPENLSEIHTGYVDGTKKLQEALDAYIDVQVQLNADPNLDSVESRMKEIQKIYDEGIKELEEADNKAAEQE